jgi:hypothetical protein
MSWRPVQGEGVSDGARLLDGSHHGDVSERTQRVGQCLDSLGVNTIVIGYEYAQHEASILATAQRKM